MSKVIAIVGTKKGAFLLESDEQREKWHVRGPFCQNWPIMHVNYEPKTGTLYAAGGDAWYGNAIWRSRDLGETWTHSSEGLNYGDDGPKMINVWNVTPAHGSVYVGVEPAGLFRSDDDGETFNHVTGLTKHPTRKDWQAGGGGLCLHTIVAHPTDPQQMYVAASAVGTFHTTDGGETWTARNSGLRNSYIPPEAPRPEIGFCVHKMVMAPGNPTLLYQQNHEGVYRSDDGGHNWQWITDGLPSDFGFPMVVHPHDPQTIYTIPLTGAETGRYMPEGAAAVWRSRNGGDSWEKLTIGLPGESAFVGVLREGMATDSLPSAGIYFGTSTGQLFVSADAGDSWRLAAEFLPPISSVEVAVVE